MAQPAEINDNSAWTKRSVLSWAFKKHWSRLGRADLIEPFPGAGVDGLADSAQDLEG